MGAWFEQAFRHIQYFIHPRGLCLSIAKPTISCNFWTTVEVFRWNTNQQFGLGSSRPHDTNLKLEWKVKLKYLGEIPCWWSTLMDPTMNQWDCGVTSSSWFKNLSWSKSWKCRDLGRKVRWVHREWPIVHWPSIPLTTLAGHSSLCFLSLSEMILLWPYYPTFNVG